VISHYKEAVHICVIEADIRSEQCRATDNDMKPLANTRAWYVLFAMLLLYATTGDFMATSVLFVDGHDCDHPWVRIEHKCVTASGQVKQALKSPAPPRINHVLPAAVERSAHPRAIGLTGCDVVILQLAPASQDPVPLRC
jgi:hypothetical protein